nr:MAG TPA_asm: hypothetical protein [Caudoviricetes sp.]
MNKVVVVATVRNGGCFLWARRNPGFYFAQKQEVRI